MNNEVNVEPKKKSNLLLIILIIIFAFLFFLLGFYYVYNEFLKPDFVAVENCDKSYDPSKNKNTKENIEDSNKSQNSDNNETSLGEKYIYDEKVETSNDNYQFDPDKIIYKDNSFDYTVGNKRQKGFTMGLSYEKISSAYKICSDDNCIEMNGDYTDIIKSYLFKGGAGVGESYVFLISQNGDLFFANEVSRGVVVSSYLPQYKDVVKLYIVDLSSDRPAGGLGSTVVAQTKDGSLYDIYDLKNQYSKYSNEISSTIWKNKN